MKVKRYAVVDIGGFLAPKIFDDIEDARKIAIEYARNMTSSSMVIYQAIEHYRPDVRDPIKDDL